MVWLVEYDMDGVVQYISKDGEHIAQFIYPHNGTDYKYVVRINRSSTFERWSNAETEEWFDDEKPAFDFLCNFQRNGD